MDDLRREKIRMVLGMNKCVAEPWLMGWDWPMSQETLLKSRYGSESHEHLDVESSPFFLFAL